MFRLRNLIAIIIIFCFISITPSYAIDDNTLKIAGDNNYPPYEYIDENGIYKGFNVDIMRAVAIEMELDIELIPMRWEKAQLALQNGKVDAIQGMTKTKIREAIFDFTDELVTNSQVIFVRLDNSFIQNINDLSGLKVAVQKGDVSTEMIEANLDIIATEKENQTLALDALLNGEVDAFVGNRLTGLYYLQKINKLDQVKIVGEPMYITQYCSATKNGNEEVLTILNQGIEAIKNNGTYDKIYRKWFGESFTDTSKKWKELLFVSVMTLLVLLIVTVIVFLWNRSLKREVENQTKQIVMKQKELDKSDRFKGKIIESIKSGIVAFDNTCKVIQSNSFAKNLFEKDITDTMTWNDLEIDEKIDPNVLQHVKNGETWSKNITWTKTNGDIRYLDSSVIPIKGPDRIEGFILFLRDYTKEKNLNEMIMHDDKMQALGKLSASIAHELRNPLTSIKAFVELIPDKLDNENFRKELIRIVPLEINRLNSLINLLLDYSRPKTSNPEQINMSDVLRDVLALTSLHIKKKNIRIINKIEELTLWADLSQIKQIILNIIINSIEAIESDGDIIIEGYVQHEKAVIKISDNGCGISEQQVNRVFEPFYTSKTQGHGIGLSITLQLVKENRGEILIDSNEGKGTIVTILLPTTEDKYKKEVIDYQ